MYNRSQKLQQLKRDCIDQFDSVSLDSFDEMPDDELKQVFPFGRIETNDGRRHCFTVAEIQRFGYVNPMTKEKLNKDEVDDLIPLEGVVNVLWVNEIEIWKEATSKEGRDWNTEIVRALNVLVKRSDGRFKFKLQNQLSNRVFATINEALDFLNQSANFRRFFPSYIVSWFPSSAFYGNGGQLLEDGQYMMVMQFALAHGLKFNVPCYVMAMADISFLRPQLIPLFLTAAQNAGITRQMIIQEISEKRSRKNYIELRRLLQQNGGSKGRYNRSRSTSKSRSRRRRMNE